MEETLVRLTEEERNEQDRWVGNLDLDVIEDAMDDAVVECFDGCEVEPDGRCPHGYSSPLLLLGLI